MFLEPSLWRVIIYEVKLSHSFCWLSREYGDIRPSRSNQGREGEGGAVVMLYACHAKACGLVPRSGIQVSEKRNIYFLPTHKDLVSLLLESSVTRGSVLSLIPPGFDIIIIRSFSWPNLAWACMCTKVI